MNKLTKIVAFILYWGIGTPLALFWGLIICAWSSMVTDKIIEIGFLQTLIGIGLLLGIIVAGVLCLVMLNWAENKLSKD